MGYREDKRFGAKIAAVRLILEKGRVRIGEIAARAEVSEYVALKALRSEPSIFRQVSGTEPCEVTENIYGHKAVKFWEFVPDKEDKDPWLKLK